MKRSPWLAVAAVALGLALAPPEAQAKPVKKPKPVTLVAETPVQVSEHFEPVNFDLTISVFTVPDGKRLVIEFASLSLVVPTGTSGFAFLTTTVGTETAKHFLPTSVQTTFNGGTSEIRTGALATRLYADPGTSVAFELHRNNSADGEADISFSGYLVDAAAP